jgi:hypothetical protein
MLSENDFAGGADEAVCWQIQFPVAYRGARHIDNSQLREEKGQKRDSDAEYEILSHRRLSFREVFGGASLVPP